MDRTAYSSRDNSIQTGQRSQTLTVTAVKTGDNVTITLSENITPSPYNRSYSCTQQSDGQLSIPNDLNVFTANLLRAVADKFIHPNTYEGDS